MRKFLFFFIVMLITFRCDNFPSDGINQGKLDAVLKLTGEEQRLAYNTLSEIEKSEIWNQHFLNTLQNQKVTQRQRKSIDNLIAINKSIRSLNEKKVNEIQENWFREALNVFNIEEIKQLAFYLGREPEPFNQVRQNKSGKSMVGPGGDDDTKNCDCNRGSIWSCSSPYSWCPDEPSECKNPSSLGCGFLFLYPCNQVCRWNQS